MTIFWYGTWSWSHSHYNSQCYLLPRPIRLYVLRACEFEESIRAIHNDMMSLCTSVHQFARCVFVLGSNWLQMTNPLTHRKGITNHVRLDSFSIIWLISIVFFFALATDQTPTKVRWGIWLSRSLMYNCFWKTVFSNHTQYGITGMRQWLW